jgi:hypothetical protein
VVLEMGISRARSGSSFSLRFTRVLTGSHAALLAKKK